MENSQDLRLLAAYNKAIEINPAPHAAIAELFAAHNSKWPKQKESGMSCPGCVQRVFRRVKTYLVNEKMIQP